MFKVWSLESELVTGNNAFLRRPKIDTTPEVEKKFFDAIQKAMSLAQARLNKNANDSSALYSLGVTYALRGNWNFLVRKAWRDALRDATTARKLHNRVSELDPSNYDARLAQGAHDYIVGSLPGPYKMIGFLAGFHGDKARGIQTLRQVASQGKSNSMDSKMLRCVIYWRGGQWSAAAPLLEELSLRFLRNSPPRFEQ